MYDNKNMYRKVKCAYDMITVIWFISIIHQTVYLIVFLGGCLISDKFRFCYCPFPRLRVLIRKMDTSKVYTEIKIQPLDAGGPRFPN